MSEAVKKNQGGVPFYAQFMKKGCDAPATGGTTRPGGTRPPATTHKAGTKGNDVDSDSDNGQSAGPKPGRPTDGFSATLKAGTCGNDCDGDTNAAR